jgi:hypothetical protein
MTMGKRFVARPADSSRTSKIDSIGYLGPGLADARATGPLDVRQSRRDRAA